MGHTRLELSVTFSHRNRPISIVNGDSRNFAKIKHHNCSDVSAPELVIVDHLVNVSCTQKRSIYHEHDVVRYMSREKPHHEVADDDVAG